jgi:fumarate hydratase class II
MSSNTVTAKDNLESIRKETDSLGPVNVPADKLWGAQTQRSLEHFSIGHDLIPREMITAYATLKKAAATANHAGKRLDDNKHRFIVEACDEILAGQHTDMFPLHVWMTGSGTQFNMNVNEVISNRCCQLAGTPVGSKTPVHPNDHVNMSQSSNDSFPTAMNIAAAVSVKQRLIPAVEALRDAITVVRPDQLKLGMLFPPQSNILETEVQTAARMAKLVFDSGLARVERPADMIVFIREHVYKPEYSVGAIGASKAA